MRRCWWCWRGASESVGGVWLGKGWYGRRGGRRARGRVARGLWGGRSLVSFNLDSIVTCRHSRYPTNTADHKHLRCPAITQPAPNFLLTRPPRVFTGVLRFPVVCLWVMTSFLHVSIVGRRVLIVRLKGRRRGEKGSFGVGWFPRRWGRTELFVTGNLLEGEYGRHIHHWLFLFEVRVMLLTPMALTEPRRWHVTGKSSER